MFDLGIDRATFQGDYFSKRPFLKRACFDHSEFGWSVIDEALDLQDPTRELMKVLYNGRVDISQYVDEYVDIGIRTRKVRKDRLYEMLAKGATVVLNRIELVSPIVRKVCTEIGRFVGAQTTSNAYACLGGEPATNVHWDTHDVFIVQISGAKRWRIYEPTHLLPISSQVSNERKHELIGDPVIDEILAAGDTLYVPRGWWHKVEPVENNDTVHLTVAIHTPLILDYIVWACASVLPELLEVRHALIGEDEDQLRINAAAVAISNALVMPSNLEAFYGRSRQRERVVSPFNITELLKKPAEVLSPNTRLTLNTRYADDTTNILRVNGVQVELEGEYQRIALVLARATSVTLERLQQQMGGLQPEELAQIVREMAIADVIQIEPRKAS